MDPTTDDYDWADAPSPAADNPNITAQTIELHASNVNDQPGISNSKNYRVGCKCHPGRLTLTDIDSFDKNVSVRVELFNDAIRKTGRCRHGRENWFCAVTGVSASGDNSNTVVLTGKMADVQKA